MSLQKLTKLQLELAILKETIDLFRSVNHYPSTYNDLVAHYNKIIKR